MKTVLVFIVLLYSFATRGQETVAFRSTYLRTIDSVLVFKPRKHTSKTPLPAVFLLHGHNANYRSWSKLVDLQKIADDYKFIVVCPDGLVKSWYINSPGSSGWQYESFFIKELVPHFREKYNLDKNKLFITGASMGGHGALWLFLNNPGIFLSAGSTSGVLNLRHSGFKKTTIADLLGPYSEENKSFDDYSVINALSKIKGLDKEMIVDCGSEDYLYAANRQFRAKCDSLKIKTKYIIQPGAHTGRYWSMSILDHFRFFADQIEKLKEPE